MSHFLPRFAVRLLVPALALTLLAALGEPIPAHASAESEQIVIEISSDVDNDFAVALQQEAEAVRLEAEAARKAARQTAAQMRWFLTLPAASSKRCNPANCAS
jgi:ABC-type sugar transport system substrate-binding protein